MGIICNDCKFLESIQERDYIRPNCRAWGYRIKIVLRSKLEARAKELLNLTETEEIAATVVTLVPVEKFNVDEIKPFSILQIDYTDPDSYPVISWTGKFVVVKVSERELTLSGARKFVSAVDTSLLSLTLMVSSFRQKGYTIAVLAVY